MTKITITLSEGFSQVLNDYRREQEVIPSKTAAVQDLVEKALRQWKLEQGAQQNANQN